MIKIQKLSLKLFKSPGTKKTGLEDKQFTLGLFDYFREGGYDVFIGIPPRNHRNALCLRL